MPRLLLSSEVTQLQHSSGREKKKTNKKKGRESRAQQTMASNAGRLLLAVNYKAQEVVSPPAQSDLQHQINLSKKLHQRVTSLPGTLLKEGAKGK